MVCVEVRSGDVVELGCETLLVKSWIRREMKTLVIAKTPRRELPTLSANLSWLSL